MQYSYSELHHTGGKWYGKKYAWLDARESAFDYKTALLQIALLQISMYYY